MSAATLSRLMCAALLLGGSGGLGAADSASAIEQGSEIYKQFCESCHGRDMATTSALVFDLRKFPKSDAERFRTSVLDGKGGMPSWRDTLSEEDVANLWAYVRSGGTKP
ncbi:MAG TPA: cytochrome c [Casimicrobiaceae bacterium]|nr:cytochrome c [Casimicrobiaceae bacterium]